MRRCCGYCLVFRGWRSERDLRAGTNGLVPRANVATATRSLGHRAVDVIKHEADVAVHIPVQAEREVLLPAAEDVPVVEINHAVARSNLPCAPVAHPPVEGTTWRNAPIRAGACAVASLLAGEDVADRKSTRLNSDH